MKSPPPEPAPPDPPAPEPQDVSPTPESPTPEPPAAESTPDHPATPDGDSDARQDLSAVSVVDLITRLRSGQLSPSSLKAPERRRCVEYLTGEGFTIDELAKLLTVGPRTISRDREQIRKANAIRRDPKYADEMAGELVRQAEIAVSQIRRVARERDISPAVKIGARRLCFVTYNDLVHTLQRLGYLPTAAQSVKADVTHHHLEETPSYLDIQEEARRLAAILQQTGAQDPEALTQLMGICDQANRLSLIKQIDDISDDITEEEEP